MGGGEREQERRKIIEKRVKELREEESGKGRGGARQERERDQRERKTWCNFLTEEEERRRKDGRIEKP